MVKADLARVVYERHGGITFKEAQELVDLMIKLMKEALLDGESVKLSGFGSLNVIDRKPRMGRNPQTGERIRLAASRYVTFRASRAVKSDIQT
ncbi:MAG TPA: integration host factor subunit alpha [Acidobacteriota bacterium]|nr:integration host factor subunit alpha [Acidobacteriota bacterium]